MFLLFVVVNDDGSCHNLVVCGEIVYQERGVVVVVVVVKGHVVKALRKSRTGENGDDCLGGATVGAATKRPREERARQGRSGG